MAKFAVGIVVPADVAEALAHYLGFTHQDLGTQRYNLASQLRTLVDFYPIK